MNLPFSLREAREGRDDEFSLSREMSRDIVLCQVFLIAITHDGNGGLPPLDSTVSTLSTLDTRHVTYRIKSVDLSRANSAASRRAPSGQSELLPRAPHFRKQKFFSVERRKIFKELEKECYTQLFNIQINVNEEFLIKTRYRKNQFLKMMNCE